MDPSFWRVAQDLLAHVNRATAELSTSEAVSEDTLAVVQRMVRAVAPLSPEQFAGADPYLVEALLTGTVACANAAWLGDAGKQRRELRVPLERARQALRDLLDERNVVADRPAKEVARWLAQITDLPQHELAALVGVATRTFQRWVSDGESTAPTGDDQMRLRTLARVVDQLRWSMTPTGVTRWLQQPHPALGDRRPADLLGEPGAYGELPRLAATTRAMVAG
jgi:putative toxin-antitoxin system antitoxin component (TIGR02293 family)